MVHSSAIDIGGLFNVRSIGDPAPWLVRSGAPEPRTVATDDALRALGVTRIIDLREPDEIDAAARTLPVVGVPIYGETPPAVGKLEDIYEQLLRTRGEALAEAVARIADTEGAALVHCTAGKDRTGLVVALALRAAGADRADVVADYAASEPQVRPAREAHALAVIDATPDADPDETMRLHVASPREAIEHALDVIDALGGPADYLTRHGLGGDRLARLRAKFAAGQTSVEPT